jgi:hypothetical protein
MPIFRVGSLQVSTPLLQYSAQNTWHFGFKRNVIGGNDSAFSPFNGLTRQTLIERYTMIRFDIFVYCSWAVERYTFTLRQYTDFFFKFIS